MLNLAFRGISSWIVVYVKRPQLHFDNGNKIGFILNPTNAPDCHQERMKMYHKILTAVLTPEIDSIRYASDLRLISTISISCCDSINM